MNRKVIIIGLGGLAVFLVAISFICPGGKQKQAEPEADTLYRTALSLQTKGRLEEAAKLYQKLIQQFPHDELAAEAWYKLGSLYSNSGRWQKARQAYAKIVSEFPNFKQISDVEKRLWQANIKVLFSPIITDKDITYKVEPGDTLAKIAHKYNTTVELIMRSNNLKSDLIRPGQRLKISRTKFSVIVDKSQNSLTLKADEAVFKVYAVATGKYNSTPSGTFQIVEKLKNPDWYKRGEGIIPADSPENVLGSRWLGLSEPGYGIHGGASIEDLGQQLTNGCIRMTDADVEELFSILPRGSEVIIVD